MIVYTIQENDDVIAVCDNMLRVEELIDYLDEMKDFIKEYNARN